MHRLLLLLPFGLAACGSALDPQEETVPMLRTFEVEYRVEGTYAACGLVYNGGAAQPVEVQQVSLPWGHRMRVEVQSNAPFTAHATATCADSTKAGKSVVSVFVDGVLKDLGAGVGFGASARATHTLYVSTP